MQKSSDSKQSNTPTIKRRRRRQHRHTPWQRLKRRITKALPWKIVAITLIVVVVFIAISQMVLITDATNQLDSSWVSLERILSVVSNKPGSELTLADFRRLESGINDLSRSLATLKGRTQLLKPLVNMRTEWVASYELLLVTQSMTAAARDTLVGLQPTINFMVGGEEDESVATQLSSGERIVELLTIGRGRFISAAGHLATVRTRLDNMNLDGISADLLLNVENVEQFYNQLNDINALAQEAPELLSQMLGLESTQSYLILSQNSDELRPSGGYISTYGWMTVRNGRVTDYSYSATTATSPFPPPEAFLDQFSIPDWWIQYRQPIYAAWDGSWYADFPATAAMAQQYYEAGGNPAAPVGGVIAIDMLGFETILEALGSVTIVDYEMVITPDNFREVVYDIRAVGEGSVPHKRFLASVYEQIFNDWQQIGRDETANADMWGAILSALQEKHIMVYFPDPQLNQAADLLQWSGRQTEAVDHDYIMVADANLGNKSNHSIVRQLTYDVELHEDRSLSSRLTVSYNYPSTLADNDPAVDARYHGQLDYNNLMQVFVPAHSILVDSDNLSQTPDIVDDAAHTVFVSRINVPYDQGQRVQFSYDTPPLVGQIGQYAHYRLLAQKQPGTIGESVLVQVSLPPGAQIISASPEPLASYELDQPVLDFRLDLTTDQWLEIIYQDAPGE
jgi:hypothetical protein